MPVQIKLLMKQVTVSSSIGKMSTEISTSECHIFIPSVIEVSNESAYNVEPYVNEATYTISYMIAADNRKRADASNVYYSYWLRSPFAAYNDYILAVNSVGEVYGYQTAPTSYGVLLEICF